MPCLFSVAYSQVMKFLKTGVSSDGQLSMASLCRQLVKGGCELDHEVLLLIGWQQCNLHSIHYQLANGVGAPAKRIWRRPGIHSSAWC